MIDTSSPLFVDVLLISIYVLIASAVVLAVGSAVRSAWLHRREQRGSSRLAWATALLTAVLLLLTYAMGGTEPIVINGRPYTDTFWLRTSDMLIDTSLWLIAIAAVCVVACSWHVGRRLKK